MSLPIDLCGQRLLLRADRTLLWEATRTLIVADTHFGKADTFRAFGLPIPGGAEEALARLGQAIDETGAERLIVLGDFWHAREGRTWELAEQLATWKTLRQSLVIELIHGNHDTAGAPPPGWGDWFLKLIDPPFVFAHFPEPSADGYTLAGHLHPGVLLFGRGRQRFKLPCFRFSETVGVLPAFGRFTGLAVDVPRDHERVFAITDDSVMAVA
jgi:uncharacterized protein